MNLSKNDEIVGVAIMKISEDAETESNADTASSAENGTGCGRQQRENLLTNNLQLLKV